MFVRMEYGGGTLAEGDRSEKSSFRSVLCREEIQDSICAALNGRGSIEYPESWKIMEG